MLRPGYDGRTTRSLAAIRRNLQSNHGIKGPIGGYQSGTIIHRKVTQHFGIFRMCSDCHETCGILRVQQGRPAGPAVVPSPALHAAVVTAAEVPILIGRHGGRI